MDANHAGASRPARRLLAEGPPATENTIGLVLMGEDTDGRILC
jgi:hypothetical protein